MNLKKQLPYRKREKGQILVIMALVFIGLIAIIGLAVDAGYLYVSYSRLRRAVDAAALSATVQFKKNVGAATLQKAAREFLILNGVPNSNSLAADVDICTTRPGDPELCTDPPRKIVRVTAREQVPMFFLAIVGLNSVPIEVTSMAEAATVDVVLVIDRSESMGIYHEDGSPIPPGTVALDPSECNQKEPTTTIDGSDPSTWTGDCHPFQEVKSAAVSFVNEFMDPAYDRVAIVVFDHVGSPVNFGTDDAPVYFSGDQAEILNAIRGLWIYDGFRDSGLGEDSRKPNQYYEWQIIDGVPTKVALKGQICAYYTFALPDTPTAGADQPPCRLLDDPISKGFRTIDCYGRWNPDLYGTDADFSQCGSTNIGHGLWWASYIFGQEVREESLMVTILLTDGVPNAGFDKDNQPICPPSLRDFGHKCNDNDPATRHPFVEGSDEFYDVDDYTRDWADVLADPESVGSLIFSIGLGDVNPPLLDYIADVGLTGTYYEAQPEDLQKIFLAIANKIATRLNR